MSMEMIGGRWRERGAESCYGFLRREAAVIGGNGGGGGVGVDRGDLKGDASRVDNWVGESTQQWGEVQFVKLSRPLLACSSRNFASR